MKGAVAFIILVLLACIGGAIYWAYVSETPSLTQDLGNTLELKDNIAVTNPSPGNTIESPLFINGVARGDWFALTDIEVEVRNANGVPVGKGIVVTTRYPDPESKFPFKGEVTFTRPLFGRFGTLVLINGNDRSQQLIIPISFK